VRGHRLRTGADVWLDDAASVDRVWDERVVPFAANLEAGRRAPRRRRPVISAPDPAWAVQAERLIARLRTALGRSVIRIDHIGSTSVSGLPAEGPRRHPGRRRRPRGREVAAAAAPAAGFVRVAGSWFGTDRFGVEHPEEVAVDADPGRPVNVNFRPVAAPVWQETLLLRDWLRADPDGRGEYAALKADLAGRPGVDVDGYGHDKLPWIRSALVRAEAWAGVQGWSP
jgi:dephospho-CoA kinase